MAGENERFVQHVFILRSWRDSPEDIWHFSLESTLERQSFTSLAELVAFLSNTFPDDAMFHDVSDEG